MILRVIAFFATSALLVAGLYLSPAINTKIVFDSASGSYAVKPADLALVCPGALYRTGGDSGTNLAEVDRTGNAITKITAEGTGSVELRRISSSQTSNLDLGTDRAFEQLVAVDALALTNLGANLASPQGSLTLTGSSFQLAATAAMRGFAAATCQQPSNDFFLVGGSTLAGREALLVLSNPTPIDATADLKIFTDLGEVKVAGLSGISVPANSTIVVSLASYAPTVPALAVQVLSSGAKLVGWIQQRAVRGTSATGVDWLGMSPAASELQVIPGLVIRGTRVINQQLGSEENSDAGHAVRVFAPEGANITVQITSADPEVFGAVFTAIVEAGTVADFPVAELKDGDYSVVVSSDKPVFASVKAVRGNPGATPRLDFAWLPAAEELTSERAVMAHDEGLSILVLANAGSENHSVMVTNLVSGSSQQVLVPASGTAALEVSGAISLSAASSIYATITVLVEGQISDLEIRDPKNLGSEVLVRFR